MDKLKKTLLFLSLAVVLFLVPVLFAGCTITIIVDDDKNGVTNGCGDKSTAIKDFRTEFFESNNWTVIAQCNEDIRTISRYNNFLAGEDIIIEGYGNSSTIFEKYDGVWYYSELDMNILPIYISSFTFPLDPSITWTNVSENNYVLSEDASIFFGDYIVILKGATAVLDAGTLTINFSSYNCNDERENFVKAFTIGNADPITRPLNAIPCQSSKL